MVERIAGSAHRENHLVLRKWVEEPPLDTGSELIYSDELSSLVHLGLRFHLQNVTCSISQDAKLKAVPEIRVSSKFRKVDATGFNGLDVTGLTTLISNSW